VLAVIAMNPSLSLDGGFVISITGMSLTIEFTVALGALEGPLR
jgi:hypothetical protein